MNTRGLKNKIKRTALFNFLRKQRYDIVCLQETHVTKKDIPLWEKQWGGQVIFQEGSNNSKGELMLVSKHFYGEISLEKKCERYILISVKQDMFTCNIANIYAPNSKSDKLIFFNELAEMCTEDCDDDLLMFGDFNCVLDNSFDIVFGKPHGSVEVNAFNNMLIKMELCYV